MMDNLTVSPNKKFLGVCAGIADRLNVDVVLIRILVVLLALATAIIPSLIIYVVVALILPQPNADYNETHINTGKKLYRSNNRKIAGVCGGIAEYFNISPTIVRLLLSVCVLLLGYGALAYIVCWILMPEAPATVN